MPQQNPRTDAQTIRVHLLDVGPEEYADSLICEFGATTVMIDGAHPGNSRSEDGHPSIPEQLDAIFGRQRPHQIDLLIVTHAHQDHIGCLPKLVSDDVVRFRWALVSDPDLGWGVLPDGRAEDAIPDARVRNLVSALRDECAPLSPRASDARVSQFVTDAANLEDAYTGMLDTLKNNDTKIVRIGKDSPARLETAFANVGLKVLGPSKKQATRCAELIAKLSRDAADSVSGMFAGDAALTPLQAYRQLTAGQLDALDVSRPGPAVNLQSAVTTFDVAGHKFLFAGDMQFVDQQVNDQTIENEVQALREAVSGVAPFDLVKLSHHGSNNAFSEEFLGELGGTVLFGICAGENSTRHPNPATLKILNQHRNEIRWARTDRNGHVTMTFGAQQPKVELDHGRINDERPTGQDIAPGPGPGPGPVAPTRVSPATTVIARPTVSQFTDTNVVEITAKIPHVDTRVVITVEVSPGPARGDGSPIAKTSSATPARSDRLPLGGGRGLASLLFVTNEARLARNIGQQEARTALAGITDAKMTLCLVPDNIGDAPAAAQTVRQRLNGNRFDGVVILGGHDVVPMYSVDCLPPDLRNRVGGNDDPDKFIVWSDDLYGDIDGDGLPEFPVSRIPDGKSSDLVLAALSAQAPGRNERVGLRNVARPFAESIFDGVAGNSHMLVSQPTVFNEPFNLDAEQIYFMLHGDYGDGTRFWGEDTPQDREAMNIGNLPQAINGVLFTGCCWGALSTETPAGMVVAGRPFGCRTPERSIALSALTRGALAFVGCTGAHYSPTEQPYNYFGGPMHRAFWAHYRAGSPPARALFEAKKDFSTGMPHGRTSPAQSAIEFKIFRQYTCLGLGW